MQINKKKSTLRGKKQLKPRKEKTSSQLKIVARNVPSKGELESLKIIRGFGIKDLERYREKIKKNIKVFEEAIAKERGEMKRIDGMIKVLKTDIKTANHLQKFAK